MAILQDFNIYQGSTFREQIYINEGIIFNITDVSLSEGNLFTLSHNHGLVTNDFLHLIDFKAVPKIENNIVQVKNPNQNTFTVDDNISYVEVNKNSRAILATNLSGYNFAGEIRQNRKEMLPNLLASANSNSREVVIKGSPVSINAGDFLVLPEVGYTENNPVRVEHIYSTSNRTFRDSRISVAVVNRPASNDVNNVAIRISTRRLSSFNILNTSPSRGLITITLDSNETESLPVSYKLDNYYYDVKAQKPNGDIETLLYGKVNVIPQITPNNNF